MEPDTLVPLLDRTNEDGLKVSQSVRPPARSSGRSVRSRRLPLSTPRVTSLPNHHPKVGDLKFNKALVVALRNDLALDGTMELYLALKDRHTTDLVLATLKRILERFKCTVQANDEAALRAAVEWLRSENEKNLRAPHVIKGEDSERYPGCFLDQIEAGTYEISRMLPPGNTYYYISFQMEDKRVAVGMENELTKEKLNAVR